MNAINWKKLLLPNIPYLLFVYLLYYLYNEYCFRLSVNSFFRII